MKRKELYEHTVVAKEWTAKRIGSIPGCVALGSADIGECELENGERVYITWGRNLNAKDQKWFVENTFLKPVWVSAFDGYAELILPDTLAEEILRMVKVQN